MAETTVSRECQVLLTSLTIQREHVLGIVDGLSDADMRRPLLPSGWNCVGLIHHLALDVERLWFRDVFAGATGEPAPAGAWHVGPSTSVESVLALYRAEIALADGIITTSSLDTPPANWPTTWGTWRMSDLREIVLHVITETAAHAGHLDAVRELIDGRTWLVLPG